MSKCPKCGAKAVALTATTIEYINDHPGMPHHRTIQTEFACGSMVLDDGELGQSGTCRIRELTAENERLRADNKVMREALEEIRTVSQCRCDEAWTDRGRHDPVCPIDQYVEADEALKALASPPHTR